MVDFLGTEAQRTLLARGAAMNVVTQGDLGTSYYGRTVGLIEPEPSGIAKLAALARLQGHSNYARVPNVRVAGLRAEAERAGLAVTHWARWVGGETAENCARRVIEETALPPDLTIVAIEETTSDAVLEAFAAMALSCGVLPPALAVLTGRDQPGLCLLARDESGRVVSCAGAAGFFRSSHPEARSECWWGMLATDPARRGARLSLLLGAQVILAMRERYGFERVMTGIEPGNAPSEAVCTRLGLAETDEAIFGVADSAMVPGGRMTK